MDGVGTEVRTVRVFFETRCSLTSVHLNSQKQSKQFRDGFVKSPLDAVNTVITVLL